MDDLVTWLRAQLDEDERVAREATPGPWRYNPNKAWHLPADLPSRRNGEEFVGAGPLDATIGVAATGPADHPQSMADARFIALYDPARVLREVEAKRRLIKQIGYYESKIDGEWGCCHDGDAILDGKCPDTKPAEIMALQILALPYADRPGYQESWRP